MWLKSNKHYQVKMLDEVPCINIIWNGFPRSDEFKEGCEFVLELIRKYKITKVLVDNRLVKVFSVDDQRWLNHEWLPRAIKAGYYASATLVTSDAFVNLAVKNITKERKNTQTVAKTFLTEDEAIAWLKSL